MRRHNPRRAVQLELFHPPRQTPAWQTLPLARQVQTVTLLAQLLQEHAYPPLDAAPPEEVSDE